ncbi:hypothetical protein AcW1_000662 [Taiwanofungus camphoratus]|nr:hypothetical protein AcV5_004560 [Antrodia cinnamomea]KAI0963639.1 hypothetical protein AcW1_000662 [Antrodia cinnamomea]
MSMYHDTLLAKFVQGNPKYKSLIPPSLHTRYTRAWSERDNKYKWAARVLQLIRFVELLIEMGLRRKASARNRWRGVVLLELIKYVLISLLGRHKSNQLGRAVLRLVLLRITWRPLLSPPIPEREFEPSSLPPESDTSSPTLAPSSPPSSLPSTPDHLRNNHVALPLHPLLTPPPPTQSALPIEDYLLPKALTTSSVKAPTCLLKPLSTPKDWLAETTFVLRPLVYAIMLSYDRKTNHPLMTALALELISRNLRRVPPPSSSLERSEYAQRDRDMLWYLLRGSIWLTWTRPKLEAFANKTVHVPLLGLFSAFLKDWIPLIDEYHYYTAP